MKDAIRHIIDADKIYSGDGMMFALYLAVLLMILFVFNDARIKKSFAFASLIILVGMYLILPLSGNEIDAELTRLFWLLLTPVVTAIGFSLLILKTEKRKKRFALLLLVFPLFLICGSFQINNYRFPPSENAYKLPQAAVDITEKILREKDSPTIIVPYTFAHPFRQISSDVYLLFGEDATFGRILHSQEEYVELAEQMEMTIPDLNMLIKAMKNHECDYIVFDTVYTELCKNGNINVNKYAVDVNYVGDRTPTISYAELPGITVVGTKEEPYWDLTAYNLEYDGTFGQYILYKFNI